MTAAAQGHLFLPEPSEDPTKDDQNTPLWIMDACRRFRTDGITIDYCSNAWALELGFVRARIAWTKEDDCLAQPYGSWTPDGRDTFGWFQCPYSNPLPFAKRLAAEWTRCPFDCLGLVKGMWSTEWWRTLSPMMTSMGTCRRRVHHYLGYDLRDSTDFESSMFYLSGAHDRGDEIRRHNRLAEAFDGLVDWWATLRLVGPTGPESETTT